MFKRAYLVPAVCICMFTYTIWLVIKTAPNDIIGFT